MAAPVEDFEVPDSVGEVSSPDAAPDLVSKEVPSAKPTAASPTKVSKDKKKPKEKEEDDEEIPF